MKSRLIVAFVIAAAGHAAANESFRGDVQPFLAAHCAKCHGDKKQEADLSLIGLAGDVADDAEAKQWAKALQRLRLGEMPPDGEPRPDAAAQQRVEAWIASELEKAGRDSGDAARLLHPGYGNRVAHQALFHPSYSAAAASPPRLWRLNPHAYSDIVYDLTKQDGFAQPFAFGAGEGIRDYAAIYSIDEPTTDLLVRNAYAVASHQMFFTVEKDGRLKGGWRTPKEVIELIDPKNADPTREQMERAVRRQFELVLQREPNEEELTLITDLMERTIEQAGRQKGVATMLAAVLLAPEAVFRLELGAGEPDEHGRRMLAPRELAYAIAFALTDERPDSQLLKAAGEGRLESREDVEREVRRLLDDEKTDKPRILRFFHEYFGYHEAPNVFKDRADFGRVRAEILVSDTDQLIQSILEKDQEVLHELLTTNKSFVNFRLDGKKGPVKAHDKDHMELAYNVPEEKWSKNQPMELPAGQRAGVLTQPSWLIAHSANTENHPIKRGKWVRERLLGGVVPDLPITVDAQLPEDPERTLRQRMEVTRQEYCWQCHQKMNPLGLSFEMFDHLGRFRETELDQPVDSSGAITLAGDSSIEGDVENAIGLIRRLADSELVRQVFIRHAFRYWMGRNEMLSDGPALVAADRAYVESGGSMKELIVALLTSDAFMYRR